MISSHLLVDDRSNHMETRHQLHRCDEPTFDPVTSVCMHACMCLGGGGGAHEAIRSINTFNNRLRNIGLTFQDLGTYSSANRSPGLQPPIQSPLTVFHDDLDPSFKFHLKISTRKQMNRSALQVLHRPSLSAV